MFNVTSTAFSSLSQISILKMSSSLTLAPKARSPKKTYREWYASRNSGFDFVCVGFWTKYHASKKYRVLWEPGLIGSCKSGISICWCHYMGGTLMGTKNIRSVKNQVSLGSWCVVYNTRRKCFRGDNVLIVCHFDPQLKSNAGGISKILSSRYNLLVVNAITHVPCTQ